MKKDTYPSGNYFVAYCTLVCLLLISCGTPKDEVVENLVNERDSLQVSLIEKDTLIHQLSYSFDEIEANLAEITKKQNTLLTHTNNEIIPNKQEEINKNISEINELMRRNADKIKSLNNQLRRLKDHNVALSRMVDILFEHVMYKNNDLAELNHLLTKKNKSINSLNNLTTSLNEYRQEKEKIIEIQKKELENKDQQLNAAYYIVAGASELKNSNILTSGNKLSANFDPRYFTQIDLREETYIPTANPAPKGIKKLLTPHPQESYEFVKNDRGTIVNIKIKDHTTFWKLSKFLVVETN